MRHPILLALIFALLGGCASGPETAGGITRPYRIEEIQLEGVSRFTAEDLSDYTFMGISSSWPWGEEFYYDDGLAQVDAERIVELYHAFGYYKAEVESVRVERVDPDSEADPPWDARVIVTVDEGPQARIVDVEHTWSKEAEPALKSQVERHASLTPGEPFEIERFTQTTGELHTMALQRGYAGTKVEEQAEVNRTTGEAHLSFHWDPGLKCRVGEIELVGLGDIPEGPVRVEIGGLSGEWYNPGRIKAMEARIYAMDVFRTVTTEVVRIRDPIPPEKDAKADLKVTVQQRSPQSLKLGVGFGVEPNRWEERVTALYTHRNLFGHLTRLNAKAKVGYAELPTIWNPQRHGLVFEINPQLERKGLLEPLLVWTLDPAYEINIQDGYKYRTPRLRTAVSRFLFGFTKATVSHTVEYFDFFDISDALKTNQTVLGDDFRDPYLLSYITLSYRIYLTDDFLKPKNGVELGVDYDLAGGVLLGDFDFQRITPYIQGYLTLGNTQLAARLQTGQIHTYGDNAGAPFSMRYRLGGADTVRGWGLSRLSPQVRNCEDGADDCRGVPIGGDTSVLANVEIRQRFSDLLLLGVFLDAGDVQAGEGVYKPSEIQYSAGLGPRVDTPVGRFRLDVGVRLNSDPERFPNEPRWSVHIALGEAF